MTRAPFRHDLALGPASAEAHWLDTGDGVRLRAAFWPAAGARGTVLLFPGRTEYVEKYGLVAEALAKRGFACAAIDWRGQGLSTRVHPDPLAGHVRSFHDYQYGVTAFVEFAAMHGLPKPWHLLAHSMGGCIGLRALHEGLPVVSAAFSSPMWGIALAPRLRPLAWSVAWASRGLGFSDRYAPGTSAVSYLEEAPFEGNLLTTDPEMFAYMQAQTRAVPELLLGGPSLNWLIEALNEARALRRMAPPRLPAYVALGSLEKIVDPLAVRQLAAHWPGARLEVYEGAEHEIMMEKPATRERFFDSVTHLFDEAACPRSAAPAAQGST